MFSSNGHYLRSFKSPLVEETHADMRSSLFLLAHAPTCVIKSEMFSSTEHYLRSFKSPLVEETHADVRSSLFLLAHAPTCVIKSQTWDVIALSDVKPPVRIDDLNRHPRYYHHEVPPFELLLIDEAAQLKECESAIPLQLPSLKHAILIGDELQLPETFSSVEHYLRSFQYPLLEEIHAEMRVSLSLVSDAPIAQICDVIALSNGMPPMCTDDLSKPPRYYHPAIITGVKGEDTNLFEVLTLKPIYTGEWKKTKEPLFATFLINLTTNIRIWGALDVEGENKNLSLIKEVLRADSKVGVMCDTCSSQEKYILKGDLKSCLNSMNLNQSQLNAVYSSIESSQCNHKCSIKLIWGPPGTGKTKTVAAMLSVLLKMKCRTLTCAPTNIAVVQVTSRLLKLLKEPIQQDLVKKQIQQDLYGLGDIVLVGNEKRMKIDDQEDLSVVFLNHHVNSLAKCFARDAGWKHHVQSIKSLLKNPSVEYRNYLKRKESVNGEGYGGRVLKFLEFVEKQLDDITRKLEHCIKSFCAHLPTSFISVEVAILMNEFVDSLQSLRKSLNADSFSSRMLRKVLEICAHLDYDVNLLMKIFSKEAKECLQLLESIQMKFSVPEIYEKRLIREFCIESACLIFCTASSSANFQRVPPFELLVIDEAAQLKECESAIPLQLPSLKHAILIGDELQLPHSEKDRCPHPCQNDIQVSLEL